MISNAEIRASIGPCWLFVGRSVNNGEMKILPGLFIGFVGLEVASATRGH